MSKNDQASEEEKSAQEKEKITGLITPEKEVEKMLVFQFNDQRDEFQELEFKEDMPLYELFDPEFILLFIDPKRYRVWIWHGSNTTTRAKFVAAKLAPKIRDRFGIAYKITTVDEGDETLGFKIAVGLEEEMDYEQIEKGPTYIGTEEDLELLEELSREKILLLLEKMGVPEGYERKLVIVKNKIFRYREYNRTYMGEVIKEKQLFELEEDVEDGPYLAKGLTPRMLFSFNKIVLTELLKKVDEEDKIEPQ
ncbi:MAG: hypothetical protein ACTSU4_02790 [Promethearchaeota archaeon]